MATCSWRHRKGYLHLKRPDRGVERGVYLPSGSQATLSLDAKRSNLVAADQFISVQVSSDGGINWYTLGEIGGAAHDAGMLSYSYDISDFASPDTMVRLFTSNGMNGNTKIWIDSLEIAYSADTVSTDIVETVFDTFSTADFAGNNGTQNWLGAWQELNDDGNPASGFVRVDNQLVISERSNGVQRSADLSLGTGATLSFDYRRQALDVATDYISLEVSSDGILWQELDRFSGPDNDSAFVAAQYDLSAYASENTTIRFMSSPESMNQYDKLFVDNVKISYTNAPDTHYPSLVDADLLHEAGI